MKLFSLICLLLLGYPAAQAQFLQPKAMRVYRIGDQVALRDSAATKSPDLFAYTFVSVGPFRNAVRVSFGSADMYFPPAKFLNASGSPYSTVSVDAAITAYVASLPANGSFVTAQDMNTAISNAISASGTLSSARVNCMIKAGESNGTGFANNTQLTSAQLLARPGVQYFNNTTNIFEPLQIGVNNNIDANIPGAYHGLENYLATSVEAGLWPGNTLYMLNVAQAGSTIALWADGSTYRTKASVRIDSIKSKFFALGVTPQYYVFYSQGINDYTAATDITLWKTKTKELITWYRSKLGYVPFLVPLFMGSTYAAYNTAWQELAASDPFIFLISSTGATTKDAAHWDSPGLSTIGANLMVPVRKTIGQKEQAYVQGQLLALSGIVATTAVSGTTATSTNVVYGTSSCGTSYTTATYINPVNSTTATGTQAGVYWAATGSGPAGAAGETTVTNSACFESLMYLDDATSAQFVIMFLSDAATSTYNPATVTFPIGGIFASSNALYTFEGAVYTQVSSAITYPCVLKLSRSGTNDLKYSYSLNNGTTWVDAATTSGRLSGHPTMYQHVMIGSSANNKALIALSK